MQTFQDSLPGIAAIVVGVQLPEDNPQIIADDLAELEALLKTLGIQVKGRLVQKRVKLSPSCMLGTGKVEELIVELKKDYTVVIVTHNMQQAARCSDFTAYMYLGDLIEFGATEQMFFKPQRKETEDYITGRFG